MWLARRNLPLVLGVLYVVDWMVLTVLRTRSPAQLKQWFAGLAAGLREPCGQRRTLRWRTVLRMTRNGRPPVI